MTKLFTIIITILTITGCAQSNTNNQSDDFKSDKETISMKLQSPAFENNHGIPSKYTCDGDNISPPLKISEIPANAKSLVLIVDDPDAPSGDWVHWLVWNIPPQTVEIKENSAPLSATQGTTDFGSTIWGGPCPPSGTHRYQFKLYALDDRLELSEDTKKTGIEQAIEDHIIDKATLIGLYQRQ